MGCAFSNINTATPQAEDLYCNTHAASSWGASDALEGLPSEEALLGELCRKYDEMPKWQAAYLKSYRTLKHNYFEQGKKGHLPNGFKRCVLKTEDGIYVGYARSEMDAMSQARRRCYFSEKNARPCERPVSSACSTRQE